MCVELGALYQAGKGTRSVYQSLWELRREYEEDALCMRLPLEVSGDSSMAFKKRRVGVVVSGVEEWRACCGSNGEKQTGGLYIFLQQTHYGKLSFADVMIITSFYIDNDRIRHRPVTRTSTSFSF